MSREIKFRGRRIDNGEWVYGHYFTTPLTDENSGTSPDAGWFFLTGEQRHCIAQNRVAFVIKPETVGEYTGLRDRNAKEIYEGDIADIGGRPLVVEWNDLCAQWFLRSATGTGYLDMNADLHEYEIIGNIYEHPHLLGDTGGDVG